MFDFYRWADWASQASLNLHRKRLRASYTFTEESKASTNPAFFVDFETDRNLGRIIVWSSGDFDISIHRDLAPKAHPMADLPEQVTDQNFKTLFDRLVAEVASS